MTGQLGYWRACSIPGCCAALVKAGGRIFDQVKLQSDLLQVVSSCEAGILGVPAGFHSMTDELSKGSGRPDSCFTPSSQDVYGTPIKRRERTLCDSREVNAGWCLDGAAVLITRVRDIRLATGACRSGALKRV
jgi:hypothetical protein